MLKLKILLILLITSCASSVSLYSKKSDTFHHEFIKTKYRGEIEVLWGYKKIQKGMPLIVFLNAPFKMNDAKGAASDFINGELSKWTNKGYVAASVSLPGYGKTKFRDDIAGPYTRKAITNVVSYLQKKDFIDGAKTVLYGVDKGAILAGFISKNVSSKLNILIDPPVDFRSYFYSHGRSHSLRRDIQDKIGSKDSTLFQRSLMQHIKKVSGTTYITHAKKNRRIKEHKIVQFYQALYFGGVKTEVKFFEHHSKTPMDESAIIIEEFIDRNI